MYCIECDKIYYSSVLSENEDVKKDTFFVTAVCALLVAGIFYFARAILDICSSEDGLAKAISIMINLYYVAQVIFFAFLANKLLLGKEGKTEAK